MNEKYKLKRAVRDYQACPIGEWLIGGPSPTLLRQKPDDDEETRKLRRKLRQYGNCPLDAFFDL